MNTYLPTVHPYHAADVARMRTFHIGFLYRVPANAGPYPPPVVVVKVSAHNFTEAQSRAEQQLANRPDAAKLRWCRLIRNWEHYQPTLFDLERQP